MNTKKLVKISNIIGLIAIVLLIYWVFTYIIISVFDLRIFREQMTAVFTISILGILALMAGALMLNIMLNLTRIAERSSEDTVQSSKKLLYALLALFPLIAVLLFTGHHLSGKRKEQILIRSAQNIVQSHAQEVQQMTAYQFTLPYLQNSAYQADILRKLDPAFRSVIVVVPDKLNDTPVYLGFGSHFSPDETPLAEATPPDTLLAHQDEKNKWLVRKVDYLFPVDTATREYLNSVFQQQNQSIRFVADGGSYTLYYPHRVNGKTIAVLVFSDYQNYGKFGS